MEPAGDPAAALAAYRKEASSVVARMGAGIRMPRTITIASQANRFAEEDSPGNYVIELKDGKPTYFFFDENGRKIVLGVIGRK